MTKLRNHFSAVGAKRSHNCPKHLVRRQQRARFPRNPRQTYSGALTVGSARHRAAILLAPAVHRVPFPRPSAPLTRNLVRYARAERMTGQGRRMERDSESPGTTLTILLLPPRPKRPEEKALQLLPVDKLPPGKLLPAGAVHHYQPSGASSVVGAGEIGSQLGSKD